MFLSVVQALVDRRQYFHAALKKSDSCAYRLLLTHVLRLLIRNRNKTAAALNQGTKKLGQSSRRFFVRQWDNSVTDVPARGIDVTELSGLQRLVTIRNTHAASLETRRQVRQRPSINQLAQDASRGAS